MGVRVPLRVPSYVTEYKLVNGRFVYRRCLGITLSSSFRYNSSAERIFFCVREL